MPHALNGERHSRSPRRSSMRFAPAGWRRSVPDSRRPKSSAPTAALRDVGSCSAEATIDAPSDARSGLSPLRPPTSLRATSCRVARRCSGSTRWTIPLARAKVNSRFAVARRVDAGPFRTSSKPGRANSRTGQRTSPNSAACCSANSNGGAPKGSPSLLVRLAMPRSRWPRRATHRHGGIPAFPLRRAHWRRPRRALQFIPVSPDATQPLSTQASRRCRPVMADTRGGPVHAAPFLTQSARRAAALSLRRDTRCEGDSCCSAARHSRLHPSGTGALPVAVS